MDNNDAIEANIDIVMDKSVSALFEIEDHVNFEVAVDWLEKKVNSTKDPVSFIGKYWEFFKRASYAYDMDDTYPSEHDVWKGAFAIAARHVVCWDLLNASYIMESDDDNRRASEGFQGWVSDLKHIPLKWRVGISKIVHELYEGDGGMAHDGNFEITTPQDLVIQSLEDPHRTVLAMTGDYSLNDLQSILEGLDSNRSSNTLPPSEFTSSEFNA